MTKTNTDSLRRAAIAAIVGATGTAMGGLVVQVVVQPATNVSHDRWRSPWSSAALPAGVAVYGFCLLALGVALSTEPTPTADTRPLTAQEQYA